MLNEGIELANVDHLMATLAPARVGVKGQSALAGISPGSPYKFPSGHESMIAHKRANANRDVK